MKTWKDDNLIDTEAEDLYSKFEHVAGYYLEPAISKLYKKLSANGLRDQEIYDVVTRCTEFILSNSNMLD